jgi:hypothetical protein
VAKGRLNGMRITSAVAGLFALPSGEPTSRKEMPFQLPAVQLSASFSRLN